MEQTGSHYEVFVNFRGKDTRQGLVNVLCDKLKAARIRHFYDDESMRIGDEISEELERGIEKSQIYIVILSKKYASSKWCLRELSLIVEWKEKSNSKEIFPIFYDVSVEDVKLRTDMFRTDLENHMVGPEELRRWEKALEKVSRIKGWNLGDTGIADFSKLVAEEIQFRLETRHLSCHLVGMREKGEDVKKLLDIESHDVRFLVIHGKSGTGKTTLARVIFNQISACFEACSFVADVKECSRGWIVESSRCDDYKYMEKRLLQDIPGDENVLSNRLGNKRVLIVLDDVHEEDSIKKLKSIRFGAGSRIIITAKRPIGLGTETERKDEHPQQPKEVISYKVQMMSYGDALKLLKRRAFGEDIVSQDQDQLARSALNWLGLGQLVPLTVEIVGSFLYGKSEMEWRRTTENLKKVYDVRSKLKIIYDTLKDDKAKHVFLDIACFFVNTETTYAKYMWKGCGVDSGMKVLTSMSLVKVIDNKFWMHEELRNLGRDFVRQNPEFGKRLWKHDEALEVLQRDQDKEEVVGLRLSDDHALQDEALAREKFISLGALRFLRLYYAKFCNELEHLLPELTWLSWHHCPDLNALQLSLHSLAVLELSKSLTTDVWLGCNQLQDAKCLKVLDLRNCQEMRGTPKFLKCKNLEVLVLQDCQNLTKLDASLGELTLLKHLTIKGCGSIKKLPEELGSLKALESIIIEGNRQSLKLPKSTGGLQSLSILVVANVKISKFPDVVGLEKLTRLSLTRCSKIKWLPDSLGNLISLVELDISDSTVEHLPSSVGNLKELKVIKMERSSIRRLPSGIKMLEKLEEIHAKECKLLGGKIKGIDKLLQLRILDLSYTGVTGLYETMSHLSLLQILHLDGCLLLHGLPELPQNLTSLHISFQLLHKMQALLPKLNHVADLVVFDTGDNEPTELQQSMVFQWIGGLLKLEHLELDIPPTLGPWLGEFSALSQLKFLKLSCTVRLLHHLPHLPSSLSSMSLSNFEVNLLDFVYLKELRYLKLYKCKISGEEKVEVGIISLVHFYARKCEIDKVEEIHHSKSLRFLHLERCTFLHKTQLKISGLEKLKRLKLFRCRRLISVQGIGEVEQLEELCISHCKSLELLEGDDISHLKNLRILTISHTKNLKPPVQGWSRLMENNNNMERIQITHCSNLNENSRKRKRFSRLYPSV